MKLIFALVGMAILALACGGDTSPFDSTPSPTVPDATQVPATASPAPGCTPRIHTVQAGDTLLGIAIKYGAELRDVVAANTDTIKDPDTLAIGQQVKVPCAQATPAPGTASGAATPTPVAH